jgi:class 3 adenylate cyclase
VHAIYRGHASKLEWRARVTIADALLDLDRVDEAAAILPPRVPAAEIQDVIYDSSARIGIALARGRVDEAVALADGILASDRLRYPATMALAAAALVAGGRLDRAETAVARGRDWAPSPALAEASARIALARGEAHEAAALLEPGLEQAEALGLGRWARRLRLLRGEALAAAGQGEAARNALQQLVDESTGLRAGREAAALAARLGLEVAVRSELGGEADAPELLPLGERLVTSLFADVRGYTGLAESSAPAENADVLATLHRLAVTEVGRRHGIVDKFAGDAVMATFNATGARVDHTELAAEAALALRDKAALLDIPIGIGIAVGPAVVGRAVAGSNVSVLGPATNLAARLQAAAATGEIVLAEEAHRRLDGWLAGRGLAAVPDLLELKGFADPQPAYRLAAGR